jgi:hypothetical protein
MKRQPKQQEPPLRKKFLPEPIRTQEEALALADIIRQKQQVDQDIPEILARIQDVDNPELP